MSVRFGCFVSYCHSTEEVTRRFVNELVEALASSVDPYIDVPKDGALVYHDEKRLRPGYKFNVALAEAICQSLCMIAVFVPKYLDHDYCRRELEAMRQVEAERRKLLGKAASQHSYVIPVVFRGALDDLPPALKGHVHCCDFSGFTTAAPRLAVQPDAMGQIERIAQYVREVYVSMRHAGPDCSKFVLPSSKTSGHWQQFASRDASPLPLRKAGR
jgi:hypothetical protein